MPRPVLSETDVQARLAFAKKYRSRPPSFWLRAVDLFIDNKTFQVPLNSKARARSASALVRGVYRKKGESLLPGCMAASKKMTSSFGVRSVVISGGVAGNGEVALWHSHSRAWGGEAAAALYSGPVLRALTRINPKKSPGGPWVVCEDNDPSGFRSTLGIESKSSHNIRELRLPPRSPDLQPLDFGIWHAINAKLRASEKRFAPSYKETRQHFLARLRRSAKSLSKEFVQRTIKDLARRCRLIFEAGGHHIEE
jgi:hypothetical protein